eukprot:COSAG02_NODE_2231_length_9435_cov_5.634854_10_plen_57_part_00
MSYQYSTFCRVWAAQGGEYGHDEVGGDGHRDSWHTHSCAMGRRPEGATTEAGHPWP